MHLDDAETQISSTASAAIVENPFFAIGSTGHCRSIPPCPDYLGWVRSTESIEKIFILVIIATFVTGWIGKLDNMKRITIPAIEEGILPPCHRRQRNESA